VLSLLYAEIKGSFNLPQKFSKKKREGFAFVLLEKKKSKMIVYIRAAS
jgi:hypothetical protein